jgi:hypothetical protein
MITKRSHKTRMLTLSLVFVISLVLPMVMGSTTGYGLAASFSGSRITGEPVTPLQKELADAISQRYASGLPAPTVTFTAQTGESLRTRMPLHPQNMANQPTTVIATTIVYFHGPQEAGYDEWPAIEVTGSLAGNDDASFSTGDLTDVIRAGVEEQVPGIEFGLEARRYSITETYELSPTMNELLTSNFNNPQIASTQADILMGFTYTGPHLKYLIEYEAEACIPWTDICGQLFYIKAGFELDWALGLRLPALVTLEGPDQLEQGTEAYFTTSLTPQDWNASQYSFYSVAAEDGNEFVLRFHFFAGILLKVVGEEICPPGFTCHVEIDENKSTSFTTPFGIGSSFPIPPAEIPVYELNTGIFNFSASITITPLLTSTEITADWHTAPGSDCSGSGTVTYTAPGVPVTFGPVSVCNLDGDPNTNEAQVVLDNFRYYFNSFQVKLGAKVVVDVFDLYSKTIEGNLFTLDLSSIFGGLGLYVGDHVQCTWDFSCTRVGPLNSIVLATPTVDETPPITTITLDGVAGTNGWYISDVQFSLSAEDPCGSGVAKIEYSFDNTNWNLYIAPVALDDEGVLTVYYRSMDAEGNVETTKTKGVKIDKTPPVITGAPTVSANEHGWWNTDVVVHFVATDDVSGIFFVTPDITVSSEGEDQSVVGAAIDMAGNEAQVTVGAINIDKTPPELTITEPLPQVHNNTDTFRVQWTTSDLLSGIDTVDGDLDGMPVSDGQLIELLLVAAGEHTVTVVAADNASNVTTQSVDFYVDTDLNGLIASIEYMCDQGMVETPGVCNSLLAKLYNAKAALDRNRCGTCRYLLNAFIHEVEALNYKQITEEASQVSIANAQYVIQHLSCITLNRR